MKGARTARVLLAAAVVATVVAVAFSGGARAGKPQTLAEGLTGAEIARLGASLASLEKEHAQLKPLADRLRRSAEVADGQRAHAPAQSVLKHHALLGLLLDGLK